MQRWTATTIQEALDLLNIDVRTDI